MSKLDTYAITLLIATLCGSCVEIIELDVKGAPNEMVIYGQINNSISYDQRIRLSLTTDDLKRPLDIPTADVTVENENGTLHPYHFDEAQGYYLPDTPFVGEPGNCYRLRVHNE